MRFSEVSPFDLKLDALELFDKQWGVVAAGPGAVCGAMTTAWGSIGVAWNVPVATVFMRPSRHTYEMMQAQKMFTLSFFGVGKERQALRLLGSRSGRECNKIQDSGLTVELFDGVPGFAEAETVLVCEKAYVQPMALQWVQEGFNSEAHYPYDGVMEDDENFHHFIMGAIRKVYIKAV